MTLPVDAADERFNTDRIRAGNAAEGCRRDKIVPSRNNGGGMENGMNCYPLALFDMDGTLIDSMPYWQSCGADYLVRRGCVPEEGLWEKLSTMSTMESAEYFQKKYGLKEPAEEIVAGFNGIMEENYRLRVPAKPGVREYLEFLSSAGVTMSICSATSRPLVEMTLERLELRHYFTDITSCDEVSAGKDRPDVFRLALRRAGVRPQEAVMYEDADFAIRTAHQLGMHVAAVYDPTCLSTKEELTPYWDVYIRDFRTLPVCPQEMR